MSDLVTTGVTDVAEALLTLYTSLAARIGVGDGTAAKTNAQTALQGTSTQYNLVTSVSRSGARLTFTTDYTGAQANFAWREVCVDRGANLMLVRKVLASALPAKPSGQTWTLQLNVDFTPG